MPLPLLPTLFSHKYFLKVFKWIDSIKYTTLNIVQGGAAVVEDQSHEGLKSWMLAVIGCKQNLFFPFF